MGTGQEVDARCLYLPDGKPAQAPLVRMMPPKRIEQIALAAVKAESNDLTLIRRVAKRVREEFDARRAADTRGYEEFLVGFDWEQVKPFHVQFICPKCGAMFERENVRGAEDLFCECGQRYRLGHAVIRAFRGEGHE